MENYTKVAIAQNIKDSFQKFGLEGTEDKINEIWKDTPVTKGMYLEVYKELIHNRSKE